MRSAKHKTSGYGKFPVKVKLVYVFLNIKIQTDAHTDKADESTARVWLIRGRWKNASYPFFLNNEM